MENNFPKEWKWVVVLGMGILVLATILRVYNLTVLPIFADEAIYVRWAQVMRAEPTLRFLPLSDGKQPLFMWSIIPALKIFPDPLFAGRFVSVISGLGTLVGIFLLTRVAFNSKKAALLAALLYTISPFSIFFDRMALVDSMLTTFGVWTILFAVLTAKSFRLDTAMLSGFALGGAVLTKSPGFFFALLLPVSALLVSWAKKRGQAVIQLLKIFGLWLVAWVIALLLYNIQRLGPNFQLIAQRNRDYVFPLSEVLSHSLTPLVGNLRLVGEYLTILLPLPLLLLALLAVWKGWRKFGKEILLLGFWFTAPLAVSILMARDLPARYIFYTIPPLFVLAGLTAETLRRWTKYKFFWGALVLLAVPTLWLDLLVVTSPSTAPLPQKEQSGYFQEWTSGIGIRETAAYIRSEKQKTREQNIVVGSEGFFGTLPNGLEIYLQDTPGITIIGVGVWITDVHPSLVEAKRAGNKVYLVVNDTRFKGDKDKLGLKLIASYPKKLRPDGTRESLLLFEVTEEAIKIFNVKKTS